MLKFTTLALKDKDKIESFVAQFEPYSDFNYTSLYSWSLHSQTKYCLTDDCLYIIMPDYITQKPFMSFMGFNPVNNLDQAMRYCEDNNINKKLQLLPSFIIERLVAYYGNSSNYFIEEDRSGYDYVIDVNKLSAAKGKDFEDYRYKISKFYKSWGKDITVIDLDIGNEKQLSKLFLLAKKWGDYKKNQGALFEDEFYALTRFFEVLKLKQNIRFKIIEMDSDYIAFISYEIIDNNFALGHFLKYDHQYKGVYTALINIAVNDLQANNIKYINIEQDLGIKSLRDAKNHLRPSYFLKKYSLEFS